MWIERYEEVKKNYIENLDDFDRLYEEIDENSGYTTLFNNFDCNVIGFENYFESSKLGISHNNKDTFKIKYFLYFNENEIEKIKESVNDDYFKKLFWLLFINVFNLKEDKFKATLCPDFICVECTMFADEKNGDFISNTTFNNLFYELSAAFFNCLLNIVTPPNNEE